MMLLDEGGVPLPLDTREHTVSKPQSRDTGSHRHDWFYIYIYSPGSYRAENPHKEAPHTRPHAFCSIRFTAFRSIRNSQHI